MARFSPASLFAGGTGLLAPAVQTNDDTSNLNRSSGDKERISNRQLVRWLGILAVVSVMGAELRRASPRSGTVELFRGRRQKKDEVDKTMVQM